MRSRVLPDTFKLANLLSAPIMFYSAWVNTCPHDRKASADSRETGGMAITSRSIKLNAALFATSMSRSASSSDSAGSKGVSFCITKKSTLFPIRKFKNALLIYRRWSFTHWLKCIINSPTCFLILSSCLFCFSVIISKAFKKLHNSTINISR